MWKDSACQTPTTATVQDSFLTCQALLAAAIHQTSFLRVHLPRGTRGGMRGGTRGWNSGWDEGLERGVGGTMRSWVAGVGRGMGMREWQAGAGPQKPNVQRDGPRRRIAEVGHGTRGGHRRWDEGPGGGSGGGMWRPEEGLKAGLEAGCRGGMRRVEVGPEAGPEAGSEAARRRVREESCEGGMRGCTSGSVLPYALAEGLWAAGQ